VLDSVVDRVSDALYLVALWVVGAPGWLCVVGGALMGLQEYTRARAGNAGMSEIGVVTIWERPTRVIVTAMFLLGAGLYAASAQQWATAGAAAWATLGVVGLAQLVVVVRRVLRGDGAGE
jgi:CDP-diacylglycerol--glycerol-3-phosphate 3-phosphatidyltransferase